MKRSILSANISKNKVKKQASMLYYNIRADNESPGPNGNTYICDVTIPTVKKIKKPVTVIIITVY